MNHHSNAESQEINTPSIKTEEENNFNSTSEMESKLAVVLFFGILALSSALPIEDSAECKSRFETTCYCTVLK